MKPQNVIATLLRRREAGMFFVLVTLVVLMTFYRREFATPGNLYLVSRQIAYVAIVALGVFFVILTSGIDLSVGSAVGLSGVLCGMAMAKGLPPVVGVIVGLLTGALIGAVNGTLVSYIGVTSFIITLGMLSVARGVVLVLTHGDSIRNIPESFIRAGLRDVGGIPMPVVVLLVVAVASHLMLTYTSYGRRIYALGGNEDAARLSGINTCRVKLSAYVLSSTFSAVTGILFIARFRSAQANAGFGMELDAIAAAVIGGTSLMGGQGTVPGVLIGATIMGVIRNGLVLMEVSSYWQELIIGSIIVLAGVLDIIRSRRR